MAKKPKQLGQILIEQGLITQEQLEKALEEHRSSPKSLGRVLIDMGLIREQDLVRALSEQVGLEFVGRHVELGEQRVEHGLGAAQLGEQLPDPGADGIQAEVLAAVQVEEHRLAVELSKDDAVRYGHRRL